MVWPMESLRGDPWRPGAITLESKSLDKGCTVERERKKMEKGKESKEKKEKERNGKKGKGE